MRYDPAICVNYTYVVHLGLFLLALRMHDWHVWSCVTTAGILRQHASALLMMGSLAMIV